MLTFYLVAGAVALGTAFVLARPLIAGRGEAEGQDTADAQIFRDQLDEVERDLARGTISEAEAEGARVEVSRRLLAASARAESAGALRPAPQGHSGLMAGLALIGTPALAAALYFGLGQPGMPDQPLSERRTVGAAQAQASDRPSQAEAEAEIAQNLPPAPAEQDPEYVALVTRLEGVVAARPDDVEGPRLLGNGLMRLGRWSEAWQVFEKTIALLDGQADAELHASQAEAMIMAAGGYVSPEAEATIARALQIDASSAIGRYYAGLALRQAGRLDEAIAIWQALRRDSPADAPYLEWLGMMLAETIQARDGTAPGPSQEDMQAAQEMTPEERMAMVEGMVARLADRLTSQGGTAEEWGRLMASYATLEQPEQAKQAFELALQAYPEGPEAEALRTHAARLQIIEPTAPGPTQEDVEAAQEMTPEARMVMIEGMVARLEGRLTSDGGTAEEWVRLINAYAKLERMDEAARVYQLAATALADDPARGFVKEQALLLGVAVE